MSFITRCPACRTAFKVVSDQLKISEGWVRCGHCQQIFDATLDLQPWWPGAEAPAQAPAMPPQPPFEPQVAYGPEPEPEPEPGHEPALAPEPVPEPAPEPLPPPPPEPVEPPSVPPVPPPPAALFQPEPGPPSTSAEEFRADPTPSFVRQAQHRALWRRPAVRWALAIVALLLASALAGQSLLHWRDPIAAHVPAAQPALETLCAPVDCEVQPPRQLDDIVIDSSVLLRRGPGRYTFNVVVRNKATVELATPALELTLTDIQDQVLVRRVLLPEEWPEPRATLAPGAEWPVQFELELATTASQVMTGYRAVLFYP